MNILNLALKSIANRRNTLILSIISISLSLLLLLSIERIRLDIKHSFSNTISGTDLIVGARTGSTELLLSSVFRIGHPSNNMSWQSFQSIKKLRGVEWAVPLSLGDSHKGFTVIGTTQDYFNFYRYGQKQTLEFQFGGPFTATQQLVLGANVAKKLNYHLNDPLIISHGTGNTSFSHHQQHPFTVVGILKSTGTPVDNSVHIPLADVVKIHGDERSEHGHEHQHEQNTLTNNSKEISAALIGLKSPILALQLQRTINQNTQQPLTAIMPKFTLRQLWQVVGLFERVLVLLSGSIVFISLLGMLALLLSTVSQRQRELAIFRSVGAPPRYIFGLICIETLLITIISSVIALIAYFSLFMLLSPTLQAEFALTIRLNWLSQSQLSFILVTLLLSLLLAMLPAWRAYRSALTTGLSHKL